LAIAAHGKILEAITISPNQSLPGMSLMTTLVGGLMWAVEILLIAGFFLSAGLWGVGSHLGNSNMSIKARNGLFIALAAGIAVGAGNSAMNWAFNTHIGMA
jgi:hypothetical protein